MTKKIKLMIISVRLFFSSNAVSKYKYKLENLPADEPLTGDYALKLSLKYETLSKKLMELKKEELLLSGFSNF